MDMKRSALALCALAIIAGGVFALASYERGGGPDAAAAGYKSIEYGIDGKRVKLDNGFAEEEAAPGSASKITTRYFGHELGADLNSDGREDAVFILTQETGGSGMFFYAVAALDTEDGYVGSEGYLLGDRIAPQTVELSRDPGHENVIVVNYADRAPGDPMTAQPSVGKSVWLKLDPQTMRFGTVERDFEGEADPSAMSLSMKKWTWVSALYNDGRKVAPNRPGDFTLTFAGDGAFSAKTDCNSMSGSYVADGGSLSFGPIAATLMFCEGSQEGEFARILEGVAGYHFTPRGELVLDLKFDSGTATFR